MVELKTWKEKSSFHYLGSIKEGTKIFFGNNISIYISTDQYKELLKKFTGRTVKLGTSRTCPPAGSVGEWLMENITKIAVASYVGSILVHEGYAQKDGGAEIIFKMVN